MTIEGLSEIALVDPAASTACRLAVVPRDAFGDFTLPIAATDDAIYVPHLSPKLAKRHHYEVIETKVSFAAP
jgi:hypothetical protein